MGEEFKRSVCLVGVGRWGKNLARNFDALGALHTICDSNESLLDTFEASYPEVKFSSNFNTVLQDPAIERVALAAPAVAHYELTKRALEAGKDVYVEKPICLDLQEGEELIHLARKKGRILMVGHLLQYHPCVQYLQELIGRGDLGKLQYISSNRLNLGHFRTEENALWNFAPHDVSVILSLCGSRLPRQVRCVGAAYLSEGVADTNLTTLSFDGDLRAHIYVSWLNPFKEQKLTVVGSSGMAVFDDTKPWDEKLLLYRNHVIWSEGQVPQARQVEGEQVHIPQLEPLREECRHFLQCCDQRITPRTDAIEGIRVLKVLQAAQASLNEDGEAKDPAEAHQNSPLKTPNYYVHPSAVVDVGAEIGEGCKVWHFSHVMGGAVLGPRCNLGQNVVVHPGALLGENVKVQNNVSLYSGVVCEKNVFLGPSCVFTNVHNPRSEIVRKDEYRSTHLAEGVTIGANATILCGLKLGTYAFVGAGAVLTKDVKPYALVLGNPGKQVGWMSRCGERLELPLSVPEGEVQEALCPKSHESYRLEGDRLSRLPMESPKGEVAGALA